MFDFSTHNSCCRISSRAKPGREPGDAPASASLPFLRLAAGEEAAVYLDPERPEWFVPGPQADRLLQGLAAGGQAAWAERDGATRLTLARLLAQLDKPPLPPHPGRAALLELNQLKECWFHLTNHCNLACRHCLFAASPARRESLAPALLRQGIAEAQALGCRLFSFTGGEPFLYPDFSAVLADILAEPHNHVAILTNGLLLNEHLPALAALPPERLHLQVSIDGGREIHDRLRGAGAFARLFANLAALREQTGLAITLAAAINRENLAEMPKIIELAAAQGMSRVHFLWHFVRGKGEAAQFVPAAEILPCLIAAQEQAEKAGVLIDNVEIMRAQVFSPPGTRYDLSNSGWESVAIGPDGRIYPSPALVGMEEAACGELAAGLEQVWRQSPVLERLRCASLLDSESYRQNPLRFLVGGGDLDHSFITGGDFTGHDPYVELYNGLALWLIRRQAQAYPLHSPAEIRLRMGDIRHDCPAGEGGVALTHCNCLLSLAGEGGRPVGDFYRQAALTANEEIFNPFAAEAAVAALVPEESRRKSYGCGSPVRDAAPAKGEVLVDLGSGSGVECFLAAAEVGPKGRVFGIDMTEEMLTLARASQGEVTARLGYDNIEFRHGLLEELPLPDAGAEVVISNCVINLSQDKRRVFGEIFRVLKPGGRLVVADVVSDLEIPLAVKNDPILRGQCLGGALRQVELMAMLRAAGFSGIRLLKRFPYRLIGGHWFYSLTYRAVRPADEEERPVAVIYRGPLAAVVAEDGTILPAGRRTIISSRLLAGLDDSVMVLDQTGAVTNLAQGDCCCAAPAPQSDLRKIEP